MDTPITKGPHHVGLTVSKLEDSAAFFTSILGWKEVGRNDAYPAIFAPELLRQGPARHMMCYEPSGIRIEFIWPGK